MRHLKYLSLVALLAFAACDDDDPTPVVVEGSVRGSVTIEGEAAQGVTVELRGDAVRSTTTNANGAYEFTGVPAGAYSVEIAGYPADATFSAVSRTAVINTAGQQVTVDFSGQYIRTSSIVVSVTASGQALGGVSVSITGAGAASGTTNAQGVYTATGLRAGSYTVAISGYDSDVTFNSASQDVTVGVGQTASVGFVGNRPSVITVAITGIVNAATGLPVNPSAVAGVIAISVTADTGNDTPQLLEAFLNDTKVYEQTFTQAALEALAAEGAEEAVINATFSVNTAAFDPETGEVEFPNGVYTASVKLTTVQGGGSNAAQTQTDLVFANEDVILIDVETGAQALDNTGLNWHGQGIEASFIHVAYSGQQATNFFSTFAGLTRTTNPAVWTSGELAGLNTANVAEPGYPVAFGGTLPLTVQAIIGGDPGPDSERGLRYDGERPAVGTDDGLADDFELTQQALGETVRVASNNWLNPGYEYDDGRPSISDALGGPHPGVGGLTVTYHSGPAALTNSALVELDAADTPGDAGLAASPVNTTYRVVALVTDGVGNSHIEEMVGAGQNPSATFGVDALAPTDQEIVSADIDRTIYNTVNAWAAAPINLGAVDDVAGFSAHPVALLYRSSNALGIECHVSDPGCVAIQQPLNFTTFLGAAPDDEAYYEYWGEVYDQAGNPTGTPSIVTFLNDVTAPNIDNISGTAGTFQAGNNYTFSAVATDNVDLGDAQFSFVFTGLLGGGNLEAVPFGGPQELGAGWDFENLTTTATPSATVSWLSGVQDTDGAGAPAGAPLPVTWARFVVHDIAQNVSTQQNNFVVGSFPAPVGFETGADPLFPGGTTFQNVSGVDFPNAPALLPAAQRALCYFAENPCTAANGVRSVTLTATVTGTSGTLANPFDEVFFTYEDDLGPTQRFINRDTTAQVTDDGVTRTWTWSVTLTGAELVLDEGALGATPGAAITIHAYGVNRANATALLAQANTDITVWGN